MPDTHQPPRQPAQRANSITTKKTLRPEKQSYRGPEQPPKAAGATNSRHNKLIKGQTEL